MRRSILLAAATLVAFAARADGQTRTNTEGFFVNGHGGFAAGNVELGDTEVGFGGGLAVGYGLNSQWQLFVGGDATSLSVSSPEVYGDYTLYQGDLGARLFFPNASSAFVGYIVGAVTGQWATGTVTQGVFRGADLDLGGFGGTVGTGFEYFFSPSLALDTVLLFTFGRFSHADATGAQAGRLPDNLQNWVTRLNVGLTWYPQAPR